MNPFLKRYEDINMKKTTLLAGLVLAAGFSSVASAHDYTSGLGTITTATDRAYIVCPAGTAKMFYQVRRNSGAAQINACGLNSSAACPAANSVITASTGVFIAGKYVATGAGAFFFTIKKNSASSVGNSYTLRAHCTSASGAHLTQADALTYFQNQ
jgi:hypothetical protein